MKRLSCLLLAICVAASLCCTTAAATRFTDVPDSFWAAEEIAWSVDDGIIRGTSATTFHPNDETLRGQMTVILYRCAGQPAVEGASSFSDVASTVYYADAARWAQGEQILVSTVSGSDRFLGDAPISRAEFCAMVYHYAGYEGIGRKTSSAAPFHDVIGLSSELRTGIDWAYANGIVNGIDAAQFAPNDTLTRAQAVVMLYRYATTFAPGEGGGTEPDPSEPTGGTTGGEGATAPDETTKTYPYPIADVVDLVNRERAKEGLSALSTNDTLMAAAQIRATELRTLFAHDRPDGSVCFTVLDEVGLPYMTAGENIAMGYPSPERVVEGWMNSPGHRANILNEYFTAIGVGYDENGRCWVQLFVG